MALLERVATLVRANLNDLIDKAEDPEKMIKQLILDMQNQLLQVKTQAAAFDRVRQKVQHAEAVSHAKSEMAGESSVDDRLAALEKEDAVDKLLAEIKTRKGVN